MHWQEGAVRGQLSPGQRAMVSHEEGHLWRQDSSVLHFKSKSGELSLLCAGTDSGSSALGGKGTASSMALAPDPSGDSAAHHPAVPLHPPPSNFFLFLFLTVNFRDFRLLGAFCLGTKEKPQQNLTLATVLYSDAARSIPSHGAELADFRWITPGVATF